VSDGHIIVIKQVLCTSIKEANEALKEAKVRNALCGLLPVLLGKYEAVPAKIHTYTRILVT
jgi:hypothetical protein